MQIERGKRHRRESETVEETNLRREIEAEQTRNRRESETIDETNLGREIDAG